VNFRMRPWPMSNTSDRGRRGGGGSGNRVPEHANEVRREGGGAAEKGQVTVRLAGPSDAASWLRLRHALWPGGTEGEHQEDIARFFAGEAREPMAVLLAENVAGQAVGLAELSLRAQAEGCQTDRVAYLEGWFVVPEARGHGVGRALIAAAEEWGRAQGCREFASDAEADNEDSSAAHRALGFTEVALVRCFRKDL
jgi:aminoglycoside 6'-N-acetyltransferase I